METLGKMKQSLNKFIMPAADWYYEIILLPIPGPILQLLYPRIIFLQLVIPLLIHQTTTLPYPT